MSQGEYFKERINPLSYCMLVTICLGDFRGPDDLRHIFYHLIMSLKLSIHLQVSVLEVNERVAEKIEGL